MNTARHLNFYGRRRGKKLSKLQEQYLDKFLPKVSLYGVSCDENPNRDFISLEQIFGKKCSVWLEIGFGGGEHLLSIAKQNSDIGVIGCEPYVNGVAMLLPRLAKEHLNNVKVFTDDARILLEVLPNFSITKLFLLFPDPWPKNKHKKRRFVNKENLEMFKRILKVNSFVYIATDVDAYARHVLEIFNNQNDFEWIAETANDWRKPWKNWENTRYFAKAGLSERKTIFLIFRKCNRELWK